MEIDKIVSDLRAAMRSFERMQENGTPFQFEHKATRAIFEAQQRRDGSYYIEIVDQGELSQGEVHQLVYKLMTNNNSRL